MIYPRSTILTLPENGTESSSVPILGIYPVPSHLLRTYVYVRTHDRGRVREASKYFGSNPALFVAASTNTEISQRMGMLSSRPIGPAADPPRAAQAGRQPNFRLSPRWHGSPAL